MALLSKNAVLSRELNGVRSLTSALAYQSFSHDIVFFAGLIFFIVLLLIEMAFRKFVIVKEAVFIAVVSNLLLNNKVGIRVFFYNKIFLSLGLLYHLLKSELPKRLLLHQRRWAFPRSVRTRLTLSISFRLSILAWSFQFFLYMRLHLKVRIRSAIVLTHCPYLMTLSSQSTLLPLIMRC